jgi:hypothetical protein
MYHFVVCELFENNLQGQIYFYTNHLFSIFYILKNKKYILFA